MKAHFTQEEETVGLKLLELVKAPDFMQMLPGKQDLSSTSKTAKTIKGQT